MNSIKESVENLVQGYAKKKNIVIGVEDNLFDTGVLDSFTVVLLLSEIQDNFGVQIAAEDLIPQNFETITSIIDILNKKYAQI